MTLQRFALTALLAISATTAQAAPKDDDPGAGYPFVASYAFFGTAAGCGFVSWTDINPLVARENALHGNDHALATVNLARGLALAKKGYCGSLEPQEIANLRANIAKAKAAGWR